MRDKFHPGRHVGDCPTRTEADPGGVKHRKHCDELPDAITEAEAAPTEQESQTEKFAKFLAWQADQDGEADDPEPPRRGRGGPRVVQPKAEKAKKPEAAPIALGDEQPNGAWWEPLSNGMTAYGFVTMLAKANKNYGKIAFAEPSSYDDGAQILFGSSTHSAHNATLGEAKVNQEFSNMTWPAELNIYDVLAEMDGWDRKLLPKNMG